MSEWQPIETAPKDEPVLLLCGAWIAVGRFMLYGFRDGGFWTLPFIDDDGRVEEACDNSWDHGIISLKPTHWMPLPDPPKSKIDLPPI